MAKAKVLLISEHNEHVQGASKGAAVDTILKTLADQGNAPDFVLCIGDDRSDEDMFIAMEHVTFSPHLPAEVSSSTFPVLNVAPVVSTSIRPAFNHRCQLLMYSAQLADHAWQHVHELALSDVLHLRSIAIVRNHP